MIERAHELDDDFLSLFGGGSGKKATGGRLRRAVSRLKNILRGKKATGGRKPKAGGKKAKTGGRKPKARKGGSKAKTGGRK